jgi:hypothetical protein
MFHLPQQCNQLYVEGTQQTAEEWRGLQEPAIVVPYTSSSYNNNINSVAA